MNRHARSRLTREQIQTLQEVIEPGIVRPAIVEAFSSDWPRSLKDGIERELYRKFRETDEEYDSHTNELLSRHRRNAEKMRGKFPFSDLETEFALSTRTVENIIQLAGYRIRPPLDEEGLKLAALLNGEIMAALSSGPLKGFGALVDCANAAIQRHGPGLSEQLHAYYEIADGRPIAR